MREKPLSDEIRAAVKASGRTNYSLAAEMGISPSTLWRFSTGKGGLSLELLDRLAEVLDLHVRIGPNTKGK
jgi:transcriptional regulator with XRE-family HTH domain